MLIYLSCVVLFIACHCSGLGCWWIFKTASLTGEGEGFWEGFC